jgi:site-specific recombinase
MLAAEQILGNADLSGDERKHRRLRELAELMSRLTAAGDLRARVDGLVALAQWVTRPDPRLPGATDAGVLPPYRRLDVLLRLLAPADTAASLRGQLATLLAESEGVRLLAETGLPNDRGLLHDSTNRLFRRLLPAPRDDHDLAVLLSRLFATRSQLDWLTALPSGLAARLAQTLFPGAAQPSKGLAGGDDVTVAAALGDDDDSGNRGGAKLESALRDSIILIAARVQGLGLSHDMRERGRPLPLRDSPFLALTAGADRLLAALAGGTPGRRAGEGVAESEARLREAVEGCREELTTIKRRLETTGISLDVIYAIEAIEEALFRLEGLLAVLVAPSAAARTGAAFALVATLARARQAELSLRALGYSNLHLLARKLVERAGRTGEHYIALTRREYSQLLASAGGGGLLTLGTAAMKLQLTGPHQALFVQGLLASANYAVSFILIQLLGFTLATKQPSMTAATLAASIGEGGAGRGVREHQERIVDQATRIVSSQLAAAVGNITTVILAAAGFDAIYQWRTGHSFMTSEKAAWVIESLHPLHSGTVFHAAFTGVILWLSSLAGGWAENFAVYRRLPLAIAEHRSGRWLGRRFTRWAADAFASNISGYGGSVALGVMLGMIPSLGAFFGLPLDVRHVTLSTGTLSLALSAGGVVVIGESGTLAAMAGIAVIFVLNLTVSFALAMAVALRAREVSRRDRWALASAILRRLLRRPQDFILPPRRTAPVAPAPAAGE